MHTNGQVYTHRDFIGLEDKQDSQIRVRVLKGPREVGKTSIIEATDMYQLVLLDEHIMRQRACHLLEL